MRSRISVLRTAPRRQDHADAHARGPAESTRRSGRLEEGDSTRAHRDWGGGSHGCGHPGRRADAQCVFDVTARQREGGGAALCAAWRGWSDLHEAGEDVFRESVRDAARPVWDVVDVAARGGVSESRQASSGSSRSPVDFGTAHSTHMKPAEDSMSELRVHNFAISLDGYGAGPRQGREHPLGVGGEELHGWYVGTRAFREINGKTGGTTGPDNDFAKRFGEGIGAYIK